MITNLEPYISAYGKKDSQLAALNKGFPEQLKKSILQLAFQGELVPQDPSDEPASVLLERIRAEKERLIEEGKIKRDKNESIIFRNFIVCHNMGTISQRLQQFYIVLQPEVAEIV